MPRITHCWIRFTNEQSHWLGPCSEYCVFYIQMASINFVPKTMLDYKQTDKLWSTGNLMDAIKLSQISDNYGCTSQCLLKVKHFPSLPWCINRFQVEKKISNSTLKLHLVQSALWSAFPCLSASLWLWKSSETPQSSTSTSAKETSIPATIIVVSPFSLLLARSSPACCSTASSTIWSKVFSLRVDFHWRVFGSAR